MQPGPGSAGRPRSGEGVERLQHLVLLIAVQVAALLHLQAGFCGLVIAGCSQSDFEPSFEQQRQHSNADVGLDLRVCVAGNRAYFAMVLNNTEIPLEGVPGPVEACQLHSGLGQLRILQQ